MNVVIVTTIFIIAYLTIPTIIMPKQPVGTPKKNPTKKEADVQD
jgi:hypothetical protein